MKEVLSELINTFILFFTREIHWSCLRLREERGRPQVGGYLHFDP